MSKQYWPYGASQSRRPHLLIAVGVSVIVGIAIISGSIAAPFTTQIETEQASRTPGVLLNQDPSASNGQSITFGAGSQCQFTDATLCGLRLRWSDEFTGTTLDTTKWNVASNSNYGSANSEDQCYRPENVALDGGMLRLETKRQTVSCGNTNPDTGNNTYYFTSGLVTTRAQFGPLKYKFAQGYAEIRAKMPKGNPFWPAFWLVSPNDGSTPGWPDYGEFDVLEAYGARPDIATGTLHYKCLNTSGHCRTSPTWYNLKTDSAFGGTATLGTPINSQASYDAYTGGTTEFNTYGFRWEANKITWYVNGRKTRLFDGTNLYRIEQNGSQTLEATTATLGQPAIPFNTVFGYEHSIILNVAFGGDGPKYEYYGYTGQDTANGYQNGNLVMDSPATMDIDYVRVYQ